MNNFGWALERLKSGNKVCRNGWNDDMVLNFIPDNRSPQIYKNLVYILLSNGEVAYCDVIDFERVSSQEKWSISQGYPYYTDYSSGKKKSVTLHRMIFPDSKMIDHENGNKLDNRRCNLRNCNSKQNNANRKGNPNTSSIFKGVSWDSSRNVWISSIQVNGKTKHIGRFKIEKEAANAYDIESKKIYGKFAKLNFPEKQFIFLVPGSTFKVNRPPLLGIYPEGTEINYQPHIDMKTAQDTVVPWLASQSDLLSEDWIIVN